MKKDDKSEAKEIGERVKQRRTELGISMPELGRRVNVNKSTIQRYEAFGVDPNRIMIINGLADALFTTPEWLLGLSDEKEYGTYTLCQMDLDKHIRSYLDTLTTVIDGEPHQQFLTTLLGQIVDLYTVFIRYWSITMKKIDGIAEDEGLKESIRRYAIEISAIQEQVYRKEMEVPIEDMKRYIDSLLHIYDKGRGFVSVPDLFGIVEEAQRKLTEKKE